MSAGGRSGTIVLHSKYGPLLPLYSTQQIGNALGWGLVDDTPNAFVWEIGHTSNFSTPAWHICYPGQTDCGSCNTANWLGITPLKILPVTFADGSARERAVTSDLGGTAEASSYCPAYGAPYCTYPWYAADSASSAITFGADYPGTKSDYGQGPQFPITMQCGGPYGPDSTYCDTALKPSPLA